MVNGDWHHLVVEVDRDAGVRMYVDGVAIAVDGGSPVPLGSLHNDGDYVVGDDLTCTQGKFF